MTTYHFEIVASIGHEPDGGFNLGFSELQEPPRRGMKFKTKHGVSLTVHDVVISYDETYGTIYELTVGVSNT